MKKQAVYRNRYGTMINFHQVDESTVEMTDYSDSWLRIMVENDYSNAYSKYLEECAKLVEPDMRLLVDDPNKNQVRLMELDEFVQLVDKYLYQDNTLKEFTDLVKPDRSRVKAIDPEGGPYLAKGDDLEWIFKDGITRIVTSIETLNKKIVLSIKK